MILRKWTGRIRNTDEADYVRYIEETGAEHYRQTKGNLGFQILVRALGDGTSEISTISWWEDIEAVKAFAGEDYGRAQYYPEDDRYLLERPDLVEHHLVVVDGIGRLGS